MENDGYVDKSPLLAPAAAAVDELKGSMAVCT